MVLCIRHMRSYLDDELVTRHSIGAAACPTAVAARDAARAWEAMSAAAEARHLARRGSATGPCLCWECGLSSGEGGGRGSADDPLLHPSIVTKLWV